MDDIGLKHMKKKSKDDKILSNFPYLGVLYCLIHAKNKASSFSCSIYGIDLETYI
jgi:hypothetical protein